MAFSDRRWLGRGGADLAAPDRPFGVMGILNLSHDSFYGDSVAPDPSGAAERARLLLAKGADVLDIGAESTRPGFAPIGAVQEAERLFPALGLIRSEFPAARLSVDAWRAETVIKALEFGADIINDVMGAADPRLPDVLAEFQPGYVLTHNPARIGRDAGGFERGGIIERVRSFFEDGLDRLVRAGLREDRIVLDPGFGFGKAPRQNLEIARKIGVFLQFGRPLLAGVSMKSFLGRLLGAPVERRGAATVAATLAIWRNGAFWHRVHDVEAAVGALRTASALMA